MIDPLQPDYAQTMTGAPHKRFLITGTNSGLGQHFLQSFGGTAFNRHAPIADYVTVAEASGPFEAIIHCAVNNARDVTPSQVPEVMDDNAGLTQRLLSIPHKTFVLVSTAAVYPLPSAEHSGPFNEDTQIYADHAQGIYALSKMVAEAYVQQAGQDHIILRPTSLLGPCSRPNTLMRVLSQPEPQLALTPASLFNAIDHRDVSNFVAQALEQNWRGIFNLASSEPISLQEAVSLCGCKARFGTIHYEVPVPDTRKIRELFPAFDKTSADALFGVKYWLLNKKQHSNPS